MSQEALSGILSAIDELTVAERNALRAAVARQQSALPSIIERLDKLEVPKENPCDTEHTTTHGRCERCGAKVVNGEAVP